MNRYYYVPVMDEHIRCNGVSLRDHLRVVDYDLFDRESNSEKEENFSFRERILGKKGSIDDVYLDRMIPRRIVLVSSPDGFYELATKRFFDTVSKSYLKNFEVSGEAVVDVFVDNLDYSIHVENFFQMYEQNKDKDSEKGKTTVSQKFLSRFPFLSKKNS